MARVVRRTRRPAERAMAPAEDYELRKIAAEADAPAGFPVAGFVVAMTSPTGPSMREMPVSRDELLGWCD